VIQIPRRKPKVCWTCYHHEDVIAQGGLSSRCGLFREEIHWEYQADDCDAYEEMVEEQP
jgi:hypothetical protein